MTTEWVAPATTRRPWATAGGLSGCRVEELIAVLERGRRLRDMKAAGIEADLGYLHGEKYLALVTGDRAAAGRFGPEKVEECE